MRKCVVWLEIHGLYNNFFTSSSDYDTWDLSLE